MQCMKCGRDVESGEVFCELCLEEMQKYPVRPGTAVVIPHRPERVQLKRPVKKQLTHEEQLDLAEADLALLRRQLHEAGAIIPGLTALA